MDGTQLRGSQSRKLAAPTGCATRSCGAAGTGRHVPQAAPPAVLPRRKRPPRRPVPTARSPPSLPPRPGLGSRRITRTCRTGAASAAPRFRQPRDWERHEQEVPPPRPRTRREARRDRPEAAPGPVLPPRGHSRDCARPQAAWLGRLAVYTQWGLGDPISCCPGPAARVRARSPCGGTPTAPLCSLLCLLTVSRVLAAQPVRKPTKCPVLSGPPGTLGVNAPGLGRG